MDYLTGRDELEALHLFIDFPLWYYYHVDNFIYHKGNGFMDDKERSKLGDVFDKQLRSLSGRPDVIFTKATTVRALISVLEITQTFIVQTYRVAGDEGEKSADTIFIEYIGAEGSLRLAIPSAVADVIARQRDALTDKSRSRAAKATAAERKANGIVPNFQKKV